MGTETRPVADDRLTIEHDGERFRFGRMPYSRSTLAIQYIVHNNRKRYFWRILTPGWFSSLPRAVQEQVCAHYGLPLAPLRAAPAEGGKR